jgi:cell wall-associated NlpC family hydrolase
MKTIALPLAVLTALMIFPGQAQQPMPKEGKAAAPTGTEAKPATAGKEETPEGPAKVAGPPVAAVSSIEAEELDGFKSYAPQLQQLVLNALALTKLNLTYTFGSASPKQGGMDCSGTIYHLLKGLGVKGVPRQSDEICGWVKNNTLLHMTPTADSLKHPELAPLQPGDLLFWSGTYESGLREIPVTHVMLYLGKLKKTGKPLVFGASDGRSYQSERRTGVSVFDFSLPPAADKSKLYGYGLIPGVGKIIPKAPAPAPAPSVVVAETETAKPMPPESKPAAEETIKRAVPSPAPAPPTADEKKSPTASTVPSSTPKKTSPATSSSKSTAKVKPKAPAKPSSSKSAPAKKPLPRTPTVQEKLGETARRLGDSIRDLISK